MAEMAACRLLNFWLCKRKQTPSFRILIFKGLNYIYAILLRTSSTVKTNLLYGFVGLWKVSKPGAGICSQTEIVPNRTKLYSGNALC